MMARPYRLQGEKCLYHIISRGDDKKKIYISSGDCNKFMDYVLKAKERYQFFLYAYCLMANHFHLLLETKLANISRIMHYINGSYTIYYNIRHDRSGHVFQGRYKSIVVDRDNYFLELTRYIHLNPVRAGIVKDPSEYIWSSYCGYMGKKDKYVDTEKINGYLGMDRNGYQRYILNGIDKFEDPLRNVYAGFLLGSVEFIKDKLKDLQVQNASEDLAFRRILQDDAAKSRAIIAAVTAYYRISLHELKRSRTRSIKARHILIYLLRTYSGLTNTEIGEIVGMRHSAVSKAGFAIERLIEIDGNVKNNINKIISNFEG